MSLYKRERQSIDSLDEITTITPWIILMKIKKRLQCLLTTEQGFLVTKKHMKNSTIRALYIASILIGR